MGEKLFSSGDAGGEKETLIQQKLATRILQTSDILSPRFGEEKTWHVESPEFGRPSLILLGPHDISEKLYTMAERTQSLHVRLQTLPEEHDDEGFLPPCYLWEICPPGGISFIGRYVSEHHQDKNLPGFGLTVFCPKLTQAVTPVDLDEHRESGLISVDMLSWFEGTEPSCDRTSPQNVLLDGIMKDRTASLKTALWILESLHTAKEIHVEEESFKL